MFQHTAARRRLDNLCGDEGGSDWFQHTAARRRLVFKTLFRFAFKWFQHTAARRRLVTHTAAMKLKQVFQHTAARRRLDGIGYHMFHEFVVSTHSRPKAAGKKPYSVHRITFDVSTHSRPKAAGKRKRKGRLKMNWFQHTAARRRLVLGIK